MDATDFTLDNTFGIWPRGFEDEMTHRLSIAIQDIDMPDLPSPREQVEFGEQVKAVHQKRKHARKHSSNFEPRTSIALQQRPPITAPEEKIKADQWATKRQQYIEAGKRDITKKPIAKWGRLAIKKLHGTFVSVPKDVQSAIEAAIRPLTSDDLARAKVAGFQSHDLRCEDKVSCARLMGLSPVQRIVLETNIREMCPSATHYTFGKLEESNAHNVNGRVLLIEDKDTGPAFFFEKNIPANDGEQPTSIVITEIGEEQFRKSRLKFADIKEREDNSAQVLNLELLKEEEIAWVTAGVDSVKAVAAELKVPLQALVERQYKSRLESELANAYDEPQLGKTTIADEFRTSVTDFQKACTSIPEFSPHNPNGDKQFAQLYNFYGIYGPNYNSDMGTFIAEYRSYDESRKALEESENLRDISPMLLLETCLDRGIPANAVTSAIQHFDSAFSELPIRLAYTDPIYDAPDLFIQCLRQKFLHRGCEPQDFSVTEFVDRIPEYEGAVRKIYAELNKTWPPTDEDTEYKKNLVQVCIGAVTLDECARGLRVKGTIYSEYDRARVRSSIPPKRYDREKLSHIAATIDCGTPDLPEKELVRQTVERYVSERKAEMTKVRNPGSVAQSQGAPKADADASSVKSSGSVKRSAI